MKKFILFVVVVVIASTGCQKVKDLLQVIACYNASAFTEKTCDQFPGVKSLTDLDSVNITFTNNSKRLLHINWIDYSGSEVTYTDLPDGGTWSIPTFLTHVWIIRKTDGACSTILIPKTGANSHEDVTFGEQ